MRSSGFTLLELLIVVVVVSIIAAFAAPSYGRLKLNAQDKDAQIMLRLIKDSQKMYKMKTDQYVTCSSTSNCNTVLNINLPGDFWQFSVPNATATAFCSQAVNSTRSWSIRQSEDIAVAGVCP